MDLSKAFDSTPHELIIAKLHAYGFDENALVLIHFYPKKAKTDCADKQRVQLLSTYCFRGTARISSRAYYLNFYRVSKKKA